VIAGMRRFLEDRRVPADPGSDLTGAEDGYQAVELLAVAAGATGDQIRSAYRESRHDLAASAFAVEPPDGLTDLLDRYRDRQHVIVVSNADEAGMAEVLHATGLMPRIHRLLARAGKPSCWTGLIPDLARQAGGPDRLVAVGTRWDRDLAAVGAVGGWTGLVDRFGRGHGSPEARAPDLPSLLPAVAARLEMLTG
jgi:FMN phosphatase YigB (HAD superfamily)